MLKEVAPKIRASHSSSVPHQDLHGERVVHVNGRRKIGGPPQRGFAGLWPACVLPPIGSTG